MLPNDLAPRLAMYGVAELLNQPEWMPLRAKLLMLYGKLSRVPGVPASWLQQVESEMARGTLLRPFPPEPYGVRRADLPPWLTGKLVGVWDQVAKDSQAVVFAFSNERRVEGLRLVDAAINRAEFWDSAYRIAVGIRDAPKNAVGAVLSGASNVAGGLAWTALKSPIVLLGLAVVAVMLIGPGKVARAALSKVK